MVINNIPFYTHTYTEKKKKEKKKKEIVSIVAIFGVFA